MQGLLMDFHVQLPALSKLHSTSRGSAFGNPSPLPFMAMHLFPSYCKQQSVEVLRDCHATCVCLGEPLYGTQYLCMCTLALT